MRDPQAGSLPDSLDGFPAVRTVLTACSMIDKVSNILVFLPDRGWHPMAIYMPKDRSSSAPDQGNGRLDLSFDSSVI